MFTFHHRGVDKFENSYVDGDEACVTDNWAAEESSAEGEHDGFGKVRHTTIWPF